MQMDPGYKSFTRRCRCNKEWIQQRADMEVLDRFQEQIVEPSLLCVPKMKLKNPSPLLTRNKLVQALFLKWISKHNIFTSSARNCKTTSTILCRGTRQLHDAAGGYSVGVPRNTGSGIEYGPGDQAYGSS